jgi:5,6,7,8-tetrahydromethanopterin hydro-lyase
MLIGESYIGEGAEAAHVNTVFGERSGPVGVAWATALASPSAGHTPFVAVVIPGLPVKPSTGPSPGGQRRLVWPVASPMR